MSIAQLSETVYEAFKQFLCTKANEKEAALVLVLMSRLFVSLEASDFKVHHVLKECSCVNPKQDTFKHNELQKLLMKHQVRVNCTADVLAQRAFMRRLTLLGDDVCGPNPKEKKRLTRDVTATVPG
jgi:hypothetical protein